MSQDYFTADVSKASNFKSLFNYVYKKYNKIDIIVNNAGVTHKPKFMETVTEKEFDKVFNVNAKSVYYCGKFFVPQMKKQKKGTLKCAFNVRFQEVTELQNNYEKTKKKRRETANSKNRT